MLRTSVLGIMLAAGLATWSTAAVAGDVEPSIVPRPASLELLPGHFALTAQTPIVVESDDAQARAVADVLVEVIQGATRLKLTPQVGATVPPRAGVHLKLTPGDAVLGPEGYELPIDPQRIVLRATEPRGLSLGVQTIRQLLPAMAATEPGATLPGLHVMDRPRYAWRGMHLDIGRHMLPVEFVKRYIDLIALHKMNTFHWHLTEDQGWRIEIKKHPKLTEIGAWRNENGQRYGGF